MTGIWGSCRLLNGYNNGWIVPSYRLRLIGFIILLNYIEAVACKFNLCVGRQMQIICRCGGEIARFACYNGFQGNCCCSKKMTVKSSFCFLVTSTKTIWSKFAFCLEGFDGFMKSTQSLNFNCAHRAPSRPFRIWINSWRSFLITRALVRGLERKSFGLIFARTTWQNRSTGSSRCWESNQQ